MTCEELDYRFSKRAAKGGWLPIETAPKDGTIVLLFGTWAGEINGVFDAPQVAVGKYVDGTSDYGRTDWWELTGGDAYACWMKPTHWMTIPSVPMGAA